MTKIFTRSTENNTTQLDEMCSSIFKQDYSADWNELGQLLVSLTKGKIGNGLD